MRLTRIVLLASCMLGLTIGLNGQTGVAPSEATWTTAQISVGPGPVREMPDGHRLMTSRVAAKTVEIRVGQTIITADAAEVGDWVGAVGPVDIVLTGNVHVRTVLDPRQR